MNLLSRAGDQWHEWVAKPDMHATVAGATDEQLMQRIAAGDRVAIQSLFARHYARVYRFVLRQVRSETMAEEVANEVFLEAWRQADRFETRAQVSTWLLAIARNKAVSLLRKRREVALADGQGEAIEDDADTPETAMQKVDKSAALLRAINQLSADHKTVIELIYYHEKALHEVSEILAIPLNTVKTRCFHARKKLAELLQQAGIDRGWP